MHHSYSFTSHRQSHRQERKKRGTQTMPVIFICNPPPSPCNPVPWLHFFFLLVLNGILFERPDRFHLIRDWAWLASKRVRFYLSYRKFKSKISLKKKWMNDGISWGLAFCFIGFYCTSWDSMISVQGHALESSPSSWHGNSSPFLSDTIVCMKLTWNTNHDTSEI